MSEEKKKWYQDPDGVTKIAALVLLLVLLLCLNLFAGEVLHKAGRLAVSGNVKALAEYLRSFGPWAIFISFFIDVLINAGSIFPSIFLSTANGLIFGLPLGIAVSWLAETTGVVLSFLLMRFFFRNTAEKLIRKANRLQDIDKASEKNGIIWMTFARALPYFPSGRQPHRQISIHRTGSGHRSRRGTLPGEHGALNRSCNRGGCGILYREEEAV